MKTEDKSVEIISDALKDFYNQMLQIGQFNLVEFFNFMESKFSEAGYRQVSDSIAPQTNILIMHDAGVGDFVMMSGAIREIRRLYPDAHIVLLVYTRALELAEFCPYVDEVIENPRPCKWYLISSYYKWNMELAQILLKYRFDICYNFIHYPDTAFLMYMSGAKHRIVYDFPEDKKDFIPLNGDLNISQTIYLANHIVPRHYFGQHITDVCFSLIDNMLCVPVKNRTLELWYSPLDMAKVKSILKDINGKIYALCFGGSGGQKIYPAEKYARLVEMILAEENDVHFVILGGGKRDSVSAEIFKNAVPKIYEQCVIDLTNKINYRQSAAILTLCDMYIGNDTGTTHMAEAAKLPVLMPKCFPADLPISFMDSPRLWHPYNVPNVTIQPAHSLPGCADNTSNYNHHGCRANQPHCITQIQPETIFRGFKILKERIAHNILAPLYLH